MKQILGNQKNIRHFEQAFMSEKMAHAYIICGPEGSGKRMLAEFIARSLLCEEVNKQKNGSLQGTALPFKPCGICPACVKTETGNHPDLIEITHAKENLITVGEVRKQLIETISVRPYYGPFKIYIMEDADLMNVNAQNALLKTIEEPPSYGLLFLLTSNVDGLLETVRSRCIRIDMDKIPEDETVALLMNAYAADPARAKAAARFARGNVGEAIELAQGTDAAEILSQTAVWMQELPGMHAFQINGIAKEIEEGDTNAYMEAIRIWCRDLLVRKATGSEEQLYFFEQHITIKDQAERLSYEDLEQLFESIDEAEAERNANVKTEAAVESMLLKIRERLTAS